MNEPGIGIHGILFIDVAACGLLAFILHLVRTQKLHVGYGVLWLLSLTVLMITVSFPPVLFFVTEAVGVIFPVSALSVIAFIFIFLVLVFISIKLTALSNRQIELIQNLALREAEDEEQKPLSTRP